MALENHIKIERSARYYSLGKISPKVKNLWIVLHGYGQLGKFFIRNFNNLESENRLIVAPEAPNRFYINGTGGRVGATWMTKDNRLRDIDDYCDYLNKIVERIKPQLNPEVSVHVFGFSQGVSTAFRWVNNFENTGLKSLHAWAGTFPPDIDYNLSQKKFNRLKITSSFASNDPYISHENANELMRQLENLKINVERFDFEGEHKIYQKPLFTIFEKGEDLKL